MCHVEFLLPEKVGLENNEIVMLIVSFGGNLRKY